MPRYPFFAERVERLPGSVFEKYRNKMRAKGKELVRLHIGDTYLQPQYSLPLEDAFKKEFPDFNRYCSTFGVEPLRQALKTKLREDNNLMVERRNILVVNGATNGLSATVQTIVQPGEEVMILTPAWPFFFGMVRAAGGNDIQVPFYTLLYESPEMDISACLGKFLTEKTVALYLNSPNNPSGKVLTRNQLEQIAEFCRRHKLWIISDEAYDGLTFDDREHISIASLPDMLPRTITIFTFSKSFMFAGLRLGFLTSGEEAVININKTMVHQLYSPSTMSQYFMVEPVTRRNEWWPTVREHYENLRNLFVENLKFDVREPEGTYFIFFSVEKYLKGKTIDDIIEKCLDEGVSVAPGIDFGKDYENYIRICFTGEPPERLELAIERLNRIFAG